MYSVEDIKSEFHKSSINKKEIIKRLIFTIENFIDIDPDSETPSLIDSRNYNLRFDILKNIIFRNFSNKQFKKKLN